MPQAHAGIHSPNFAFVAEHDGVLLCYCAAQALDQGHFKTEGGFPRRNNVFDGKLEVLLQDISGEIWKDAR